MLLNFAEKSFQSTHDFLPNLNIYKEDLSKVKYGQRVLVCFNENAKLAQIFAFLYRRGCTIIPISPSSNKSNLEKIIHHSEPHVIVSDSGFFWNDSKNSTETSGPNFIIYTSGSTGNPKGVFLEKRAIENNAADLISIHGFGKNHIHCSCLSLNHCNAIMMSLIGNLLAEGRYLVSKKEEIEEILVICDKYKVNTLSLVPFLVEKMLESNYKWPKSLNYIITAAAPLSQSISKRFFLKYGPKLIQGYGLTEAVNFSTVMPLLNSEDFIKMYISQKPPVGKPLKSQMIKIENGEVFIKGASLMHGYLKNETETKKAITHDGWLRTGDIGKISKGFLYLIGRKKEVINRGGTSMYPSDLQEALVPYGIDGETIACATSDPSLHNGVAFWNNHYDIKLFDLTFLKKDILSDCLVFSKIPKTESLKVKRAVMENKSTSLNFATDDSNLKQKSIKFVESSMGIKIKEKFTTSLNLIEKNKNDTSINFYWSNSLDDINKKKVKTLMRELFNFKLSYISAIYIRTPVREGVLVLWSNN